MLKKLLLYFLFAASACAQLTQDQKVFDFQSLGSIYSKRYAPLDWKKTLFGFNALDLSGWLDRVRATSNDLDFYELMVEYLSDLQDGHDSYQLPSNFVAQLGFGVDVYDGKVLIDTITRTSLPLLQYPFVIGDGGWNTGRRSDPSVREICTVWKRPQHAACGCP